MKEELTLEKVQAACTVFNTEDNEFPDCTTVVLQQHLCPACGFDAWAKPDGGKLKCGLCNWDMVPVNHGYGLLLGSKTALEEIAE